MTDDTIESLRAEIERLEAEVRLLVNVACEAAGVFPASAPDNAAAVRLAVEGGIEKATARFTRALAAGPAALRKITDDYAAALVEDAQADAMKITHANRCPHCLRYFTTPQGLGQHFRHAKRKPARCRSVTR